MFLRQLVKFTVLALTLIPSPGYGQLKNTREPGSATGIVFHDRNGNRVFDPGEKPLSGVCVSNGRDVVETDGEGRYQLSVTDDTILFVVKPNGWSLPVNEFNLPQFYYIHKPHGSPKRKFPGVPPTGSLPESIDFPLRKSKESRRFKVIIFGDIQVRNRAEIGYFTKDFIDPLVESTAAFGITLGDVVHNELSLFGQVNEMVGKIGIPWYNTLGNHDLYADAIDDKHRDEVFELHYGPTTYAFNYGNVHFIVLNNVQWLPRTGDSRRRRYKFGLTEDILAFVEQDLDRIPHDRLVVLIFHIPCVPCNDLKALFSLVQRYDHTFSLAAHFHWQEHRFLGSEYGWMRPDLHHHLVHVAACGSRWAGSHDTRGVPHAMAKCGMPNGYSIIEFDGGSSGLFNGFVCSSANPGYSIRYMPAGHDSEYQMNISEPRLNDTGNAYLLYVNVFAGSSRSNVEIQLDDQGYWMQLSQVKEYDPTFQRLYRNEKSLNLPKPIASPHLWCFELPRSLSTGYHIAHVRTTDMFGQTYESRRVFYIAGEKLRR